MRRHLATVLAVAAVVTACSGGAEPASVERRAGRDGREARSFALGADPSPFAFPGATGADPDPAPVAPTGAGSVRLAAFDGCEDLLGHVRDEAGRLVTAWGLNGYGYPMGGDVVLADGRASADSAAGGGEAAPAAPATGGTGGAAEDKFSGTNVQEAGIDEPDLVKTDGRIVLAVAQGRLRRVDLGAGGPERLTDVTLEGGYPSELLLVGDRALVFGHGDGAAGVDQRGPIAPYGGGQSVVWVVDLAGGGLEVVATLRVDGAYLSARLVDGIARVVLSSPLRTPPLETPEDDSPEAQQRALDENKRRVAASTLDQWMPRYELAVSGQGGPSVTSGRICACDELLQPSEFSGLGTISVLTIDPADPSPETAASVMASGQNVYASVRRLYVATGQWQTFMGDVAVDRAASPQDLTTAVHAFDITDAERATYLASGAVPGWVINQWAMSEHEGVLRVATTVGFGSGGPSDPSESMVTVLREDGQGLVPVGRVGGLGRGERIYAVRFMGATGYVVTFRQTDPLYVLDLADPTAPRTLGELKIPGFSAYLHPVADGILMGVGQDADDQGQALGVQASLFDVRDPAAPARRAQWSEGRPSHSPVEYDHRAFLHWAPSGVAVVPVESWPQTPEDQAREPNGSRHAVVLRVTTGASTALDEVGRITHDGRASEGAYAAIMRSFVVGDVLYTMSDAGLLATDAGTLADREWVAFR